MASGDTLAVFMPYSNEPPTVAYATLDHRNQRPCLDFDDTADENAVFSYIMPRHYGGGGVTAYFHYGMTTATSGKVRLEAAFERVTGGQALGSDGFASTQAVNVAAVPASAIEDIQSIAFTNGAQMDSVVAGDGFRFKVTRKSTDTTNDTASGDLELLGIELKET